MIGIRYPMDAHVVGDAKETLKELIPLLRRKKDRSWREEIEANVRSWNTVMDKRAGQSFGGKINPQGTSTRSRGSSAPWAGAKKTAKSASRDPQRMGLAARGFRQRLPDVYESMPGRKH